MFMRRMGRPGLLGMAARTAVVAGTATAVSGAVARHQQNRAQEQAEAQAYEQQAYQQQVYQPQGDAQPAAPASSPEQDLVGELARLGELKDKGLLSDGEFQAAKAKLLG